MKYQLTIVAESLQELQGVIDRLEPRCGGTVLPSDTHAPGVVVYGQAGSQVASAFGQLPATQPVGVVVPVPAPIVDDEEEEDDAPAVFAAPAPNSVMAAPPVMAPAAPAASPTPAGASEELDPRGFPWDERIHSSSKQRLAKGNFWKNRKNLPAGLIEQVEAELRAKGYGNPQTGAAPAPAAPVVAPAPALPGLPTPAPVAAPAAPVANQGAVKVKEKMTAGLAAGLFDAPKLIKMIKAMGLEQMNDLAKFAGDFDQVLAAIELITRLSGLVTSGRVDQAWVGQVTGFYGVADMYELTGNLPVVAQIKDYLDSNGL